MRPSSTDRARSDEDARDLFRALVLGALAVLVYLTTAPGVVNLDGLGYLKLIPHNFAAGHLLYMPLLRAATRFDHGNALAAGRLLDALCGGSAALLTYGIVRRVLDGPGGRFAATVAAAGMALSYGTWVECADVEAYAAALVALLCTIRLALSYAARPTTWRALATGALLGVAVLCHLTHVLLTPFVAGWLWAHASSRRRGLAHAALALVTGGALSLGMYAYAAFVVRHHDLAGAIAWVRTASHGFRYGGGPYRLGDAVYGLAKSIIWSPYLYEANAPKLLGQFLLGLAPLVALGIALARRPRSLERVPLGLGLLWVVPYALVGIFFFGSDTERWLFILPALWLLAGGCLLELHGRRRFAVAAALLLYVGGLNYVTAIRPAHEDSWDRTRAEATAAHFHDGDLIIFPGHSWGEYVSFYADGKRLEPFPIVYYVARDGEKAAFARLDRDVARVARAGGHIWALRIFDNDPDRRGLYELETLGLPRAALRQRLLARFQGHPEPLLDGLTVERLDPLPRP